MSFDGNSGIAAHVCCYNPQMKRYRRIAAAALGLTGCLAAGGATATGLYSDPIGNPAAEMQGTDALATRLPHDGVLFCAYERTGSDPAVMKVTWTGSQIEWVMNGATYYTAEITTGDNSNLVAVTRAGPAAVTMVLDTEGLRYSLGEIGGPRPVFLAGRCARP